MSDVVPRRFYDFDCINDFRAEIRNTLYFLFSKRCPKPHYMTLKNYLSKHKGLSNNTLEKCFSKRSIKKMEVDPDGETFNISLLYECIEMVFLSVADYKDPISTSPSCTFESALISLQQSHRKLLHAALSKHTRDELLSLGKDVKEKLEIVINRATEEFKIQDTDTDAYVRETTSSMTYDQGRQHLGGTTSLFTEYLDLTINEYKNYLRGAGAAGDPYDLEKILEFVWWESLVCFSQDSVVLTEKSRKNLEDACSDYELPFKEMFQTFFSVEDSLTGGPLKVSFSQVDLQAFYAAIGIMNDLNPVEEEVIAIVRKNVRKSLHCQCILPKSFLELTDCFEKRLSKMVKKKPRVVDILKKLTCNGASLNLAKYQKVLLYLTGLLKANFRLDKASAKELVGLLQTACLSDSELWLDVITESEYDQNILAEVGKIIPKHQLCARDVTLMAAFLLLKDQEDFKSIELYIESDPYKLPALKKMQEILSTRQTELQLAFIHHWKYPELGCSDEFLESSARDPGKEGGRLIKFAGSLMKLSLLDKRVKLLQLAFGRRLANNLDRDLEYMHDFSDVERLGVHVVGGLAPDCFPLLPKKIMPLDLWFSDTCDSDVEWTGNAIRKLLDTNNSRQIMSLRFPRSKFTVDGCLKLARQLEGFVIGESGILVASVNLSEKDAETLQELNFKFSLSDEIKIWEF